MNKSNPNSLAKKPLRAAAAEVSAPEITVQAVCEVITQNI